ncbi:hypothetical protein RCH06_001461 [Polaromonas sp. CG_9.5]|uniref:hypothetical protein n=1 Tax=Polaromonas sp. CG_9.5 TaxID=3071705 RepID=UPI002E02E1D4|nr:hypothetical protein [Polaromonas sp. CG_9.5]
MPIYRRTPAGNEAVLNSKGDLPRKLRSLLMVVNGNTPLSVYRETLSSFGDVAALMRALEAQGLVEQVMAPPDSAASIGNVPAAPRSAPGFVSPPAAWTPAAGPSASGASPATLTDDLAAWASFGDELSTAGLAPAGNAAFGNAAYQLRKALLLVSDFVAVHLPEQSLEIVLAFETLGSAEQVIGSLDGYEALVAPLGEPARRHLAELRQTLTTP